LKSLRDSMIGGAWPFLVGGVICLVYSVNERDRRLLSRGGKGCGGGVGKGVRPLVQPAPFVGRGWFGSVEGVKPGS